MISCPLGNKERPPPVVRVDPEHGVVDYREPGGETDAEAVLRDVTKTGLGSLTGCCCGEVRTVDDDVSSGGWTEADDHLSEFSLAITSDPGYTNNLSRPDGDIGGMECVDAPVVASRELGHLEQRCAWLL